MGSEMCIRDRLQVVDGKSPIYDWVKVSALRPVMQGLKDDERHGSSTTT